MAIEYAIVAAVVGALYLIVKQFAPDFPVTPDMFLLVFLWVLARLGVEVVGVPAARIRGFFAKRFKQAKRK